MFLLDLFSGAGGLAEGFIAEGFIPVSHVEMDVDAINTLHTRVAYHYLRSENKLSEYIKYLNHEITRDHIYGMLPSLISNTFINEMLAPETIDTVCTTIERNMKLLGCNDLDVLIGGPPCQTYSIISRNNEKYKNPKDQRNYLYKMYAKMLGRFKPKFFVFENVPGIKTISGGSVFKELISIIEKQGYVVVPKELDASNFGVLQKRTRVIVTGWREELNTKNVDYGQETYGEAIVDDILLDLTRLSPGEENNTYVKDPSSYLVNSGLRSEANIPLTQHICRYQNPNDREIYRIATRLWNKHGKRLVYAELPAHLITRSKPNIFSDRYKVVAGDLPYSHTVIAHIAKDGHYYIHPDTKQARSISVREAARIQSFPDSFYFEGSRNKVFTQIGNAVPPLMAKQLARTIKEAITYV